MVENTTEKKTPTSSQRLAAQRKLEATSRYQPPNVVLPADYLLFFEAVKLYAQTIGPDKWPKIDEVYLRSRKVGDQYEVRRGRWVGIDLTIKPIKLPAPNVAVQTIEEARQTVKLIAADFLGHITDPGQTTKIKQLQPVFCPKDQEYLPLNSSHAVACSLQLYSLFGTGCMRLTINNRLKYGLVVFSKANIAELCGHVLKAAKKRASRAPHDSEKILLTKIVDKTWQQWLEWPAASSVDTEIRCFMELEVSHAEKKVQPRVQA